MVVEKINLDVLINKVFKGRIDSLDNFSNSNIAKPSIFDFDIDSKGKLNTCNNEKILVSFNDLFLIPSKLLYGWKVGQRENVPFIVVDNIPNNAEINMEEFPFIYGIVNSKVDELIIKTTDRIGFPIVKNCEINKLFTVGKGENLHKTWEEVEGDFGNLGEMNEITFKNSSCKVHTGEGFIISEE